MICASRGGTRHRQCRPAVGSVVGCASAREAMCGSDALGTPPRHTLRRVSGAGQRLCTTCSARLASGCNTLASLDDLHGRRVACSGRVVLPVAAQLLILKLNRRRISRCSPRSRGALLVGLRRRRRYTRAAGQPHRRREPQAVNAVRRAPGVPNFPNPPTELHG